MARRSLTAAAAATFTASIALLGGVGMVESYAAADGPSEVTTTADPTPTPSSPVQPTPTVPTPPTSASVDCNYDPALSPALIPQGAVTVSWVPRSDAPAGTTYVLLERPASAMTWGTPDAAMHLGTTGSLPAPPPGQTWEYAVEVETSQGAFSSPVVAGVCVHQATPTTVAPAPVKSANAIPHIGSGPDGVSINSGDVYTDDADVTISASISGYYSYALLSNDGGFQHASKVPLQASMPWKLQTSGAERLPKTVYVRFVDADGFPSDTYQDDIILDLTAPKISSASASSAGAGRVVAARAGGHAYRLKVKASDKTSGVGSMQVAPSTHKPGKWKTFKKHSTATLKGKHLYVRVRDKAGNPSKWRKVR